MKTIKKILSIDIGGTNIKSSVLDADGKLLTEYKKLPTPNPATPNAVIKVIKKLTEGWDYDVIASGFPGYLKEGVVFTAPNLGTEVWKGCKFQDLLAKSFGKPARVVNDADMQGLGIMSGKGFEIVVTLGTGFGSAFFYNGVLLPHMEVAHHPIKKDKTYDEYIGQKAFDKAGKKRWNEHLKFIIQTLKTVYNYDTLYLGGGNAKKIDFELDKNIKIVTNEEGIDGGAKLWQQKA
ncbi:ROK family protein [Rhizosphaericola mali]|uniref:ROK family protein n=1 Tax=Rhizosphaericola mali TaxID=2545455 RepID=A0A5P2GBH2_9BACT|nr:ROK family protein [Rhizosphaericola mali]QES90563.1 ROK family protein [Rhizosphaericola mali]